VKWRVEEVTLAVGDPQGSRLLEHSEWVLREAGCTRLHDHADPPDESGGAATAFARAHG
jgi:hypothetical protein